MSGEKFTPEPAESFAIEYGSARFVEISGLMTQLGFVFESGHVESSDEENDTVIKKGTATDGTTIEIIIKKGPDYKSPAAIEERKKLQATLERVNILIGLTNKSVNGEIFDKAGYIDVSQVPINKLLVRFILGRDNGTDQGGIFVDIETGEVSFSDVGTACTRYLRESSRNDPVKVVDNLIAQLQAAQ